MPGSLGKIGGIVLCGGKSTRMGRPKEWLPIAGEFLLQRVVRVVGEAARPVVVAARSGQELPPLPEGVAVVHDAVEDFGPLAGIAAGMEALAERERLDPHPNPSPLKGEGLLHGSAGASPSQGCEAAVIVSCDHPLLRKEVIAHLMDSLGGHRAIIVRDGEQVYPLLGVYRLGVRAILDQLISQGEHRARRFAEQCGAREISCDVLRDVDPQLSCLRNINDPRSYAESVAVDEQRLGSKRRP